MGDRTLVAFLAKFRRGSSTALSLAACCTPKRTAGSTAIPPPPFYGLPSASDLEKSSDPPLETCRNAPAHCPLFFGSAPIRNRRPVFCPWRDSSGASTFAVGKRPGSASSPIVGYRLVNCLNRSGHPISRTSRSFANRGICSFALVSDSRGPSRSPILCISDGRYSAVACDQSVRLFQDTFTASVVSSHSDIKVAASLRFPEGTGTHFPLGTGAQPSPRRVPPGFWPP